MRAIAINGFGGPDVFEAADLPMPEPGPGELLIAVKATSVNPVDYKIRDGRAAFLCPAFPAVLHPDCAGVVKAVGDGVSAFEPGHEVYAFASGIAGKQGALAEHMLADARMAAHKPRSLGFAEAAALPLVAMTAYFALFDGNVVGPGKNVLVQGGTGGVGHIAVQLAKWLGADVYATSGTPEKRALAKSLGAIEAFDYRAADAAENMMAATEGRGFDVVFNTPGLPSIDQSVAVAAFGGTILDILGEFPTQPGFQAKWLTFRSIFAGIPIMTGHRAEEVGDFLTRLARLADEGHAAPVIDERRFTFASVGEAHRVAEHGSPTGKVVISAEW